MAIHLLLFCPSPPKIPSLNRNSSPGPKSLFNLKPVVGFHSSRREAISIVPLTLALTLTLASSLSSNALSETLEASPPPPPRKQALNGICSTKSWFQFNGDGFSIRVPPQFEDIMEPEDYTAGMTLYGDKVKPKAYAARFASPDGSEVLSVVIRPTNQLKITFLEAKDITDLGSLKAAAKIFVPGGANLYSARTFKIKEDEGFRTYYFYEFGTDGQHIALVVSVNSGKAYIAGATAPQFKWEDDGNHLIHDHIPVSAAKSPSDYKNRVSLSFAMDQKNQATPAASKPLGMCEKLFSAFQPTLRPLRRLTFRRQETAGDSLPAQAHPGPIPQPKLPEPVAPPQGKSMLPKVLHNPKPKHHQEKPLPTPAPPNAEVRPLGPAPQPKAEVHKPRKGINEKVDEYINRILRER